MKIRFTLIFFLFATLISHAQQATVKGKIIDATTKEGLIGVNVLLADGTGTASDINGDYKLSTPTGEVKISFRYVGYATKEVTLQLAAGEVKVLDVTLSEVNTELETVVVSAGKYEQKLEDITVTMAVIKPALIENRNTTNAETIIDQVPGCTVQDGQVSIRGGSGFAYGAGSRVLMMVDELPLLSADAGDVKWNTLPIENIEQIEVIKGASSVLFGSSALNGAINIRTGYPKDKPMTKITLTNGFYGNPKRDSIKWWDNNPYYTGISFFHSQKVGQLDVTIGGAGFTDRGYREGEDEHRGRFNFNLRYRSKKYTGLSFGLNGNSQYSKSGVYIIWQDANNVYRPYGGADPDHNPESTISINYGTRVNYDPYITYFTKNGSKHTLRTRWYWVKNKNNTNQSSDAYLYYGEYQYSKMFKNEMNLTTGVASYYSRINSQLYGDHHGANAAAFAQLDKKIGKLNLSGGMRFEYFKIDTAETVSTFRIIRGTDTTTFPIQPVFRMGASYHIAKETYLRASFGQGYRFPSVAEKYVSTAVGALNIFPNPAVGPEKGWSAEIGVKQGIKCGKWIGYVDVAGFWTEYDNMMEFTFGTYVPKGVTPNLNPSHPNYVINYVGFRAQNAEKARISGIDFSIVGKGKIFEELDMTVFAGYTYMDPITLNDDSTYRSSLSDTTSSMLKYRYKHLAKADVQFDYKGWTMGISARYNSKMVNIDASFENLIVPIGSGSLPLGDYILPGLPKYRKDHNYGEALVFDFRLGYNINKNARLSTMINNVFNLEYMGRPGDVMPPRTFSMQFIVSF